MNLFEKAWKVFKKPTSIQRPFTVSLPFSRTGYVLQNGKWKAFEKPPVTWKSILAILIFLLLFAFLAYLFSRN